MGLVLPLVLLQDAWRGVLISTGRPAAATLNDAIWTVSQFAALGWLLAMGIEDTSILVLTWGAAGGLAAAFGILQTRAIPRLQDTRRWLAHHWDLAGFFLAEWILVVGAMHGSLLLIAAWASVEDVGALRGSQVLLGPLTLLASGAFEFVLPELGRRPQLSAGVRLRLSYLVSGSLVLVGLTWGAALLALPNSIGRQLMGDTWLSARAVLPASTLWSCAILLSTGPAVVLRALGRARVGFRINALTAPLLVIFSLVGVELDGATGAAAGFALAHWLMAPLWWRGVRRAVAEAALAEPVLAEPALAEPRRGQPAAAVEPSLRLLVTVWTLHENGGLRVVLELARQWNLSGTPAEVFALQPARTRAAAVDPVVPLRYGCRGGSRLRFAWPIALARLVRAARTADVVVSSTEIGPSLIFGFLAARLAGRPFATIVHSNLQAAMTDWMPPYLHPLARWIHRHADATVCVSPRLVSKLLEAGVQQSRIRVIPNGIDVERVRALADRPSKLTAPGEVTVLASGRLSPEKGFDVLIRAHAQLRQVGVAHRLVILGEGPERAQLLLLARSLEVDDTVELPGFLDNPFPEIAAADLFCLPSRYEGFPLALLEALALEVPVVASACGSELLSDGEYGDLVSIGSIDELAAAIERHLRDPKRLRQAAHRGSRWTRRFAWAHIAEEYRSVLAEVQTRGLDDPEPA
jgi:glycosyltransferase involved in cell wall biosynthesis